MKQATSPGLVFFFPLSFLISCVFVCVHISACLHAPNSSTSRIPNELFCSEVLCVQLVSLEAHTAADPFMDHSFLVVRGLT